MISSLTKIKAIKYLSAGASLIAIVYTPWLSIDAFTPIKYALAFFFILFLIIFFRRDFHKVLFTSKNEKFLLSTLIVSILITLLSAPEKLSQKLYGSTERMLGVGSFVLLAVLLLITKNLFAGDYRDIKIKSVLRTAQVSNLFVGCIFIFQLNGFWFVTSENEYFAPVSTLGNPNFFAAFMSLSAISWIPNLFYKDEKLWVRFGALFAIGITAYSILNSTSFQGILLIAVGAVSVLWLILAKCTKFSLPWSLNVLLSLVIVLAISLWSNFLNVRSQLSGQTLQIRLHYWEIAVRMVLDRPFFGWGFDSFGDNFRRFQTLEEYQTFGPGVFSDSAHNYFLDFVLAGGLIFALVLVWVLGIIVRVGFTYWNSKEALRLSPEILDESAIASMGIVFFVQSFINPFNIAIAFWGAFIFGCIISINSRTMKKSRELSIVNQKKGQITASNQRGVLVNLIAIVFFNPVLASVPFLTDHNFRNAAQSGNLSDLETLSLQLPVSNFRFNAVTSALLSEAYMPEYLRTSANSVPPEQLKEIVLKLSYKMLEINQDSISAWLNIERVESDIERREKALARIKQLDPNNPKWESD